MSNLDLNSLYRTTIGFDRIPLLLRAMQGRPEADTIYPPYNIEKVGEDRYRIVIALAGFNRDDIEIVCEHQRLTVHGKMADRSDVEFLHRGIAGRPFERRFELADHIEVVSADFDTGLLTIELKREVPEKLKPRTIEIRAAGQQPHLLENQGQEAA